MALMQGITHDLVSTSANMVAIDGVVIHKAAHFTTDSTGAARQHRDTSRQSAANLDGNSRWLAIENEDHGPAYGAWNVQDGHQVPAFTVQQCESLAHLLLWIYRTHGVPLELVPDTLPGRRGIAYHRQGIDGDYSSYAYGGRVPGGVRFSSSIGKVCPGDRRIGQLINVIIPRARVLGGLQQEDDMAFTDTSQQQLSDIQLRVASMHAGQFLPWPGVPGAPGGNLFWFQEQASAALVSVKAMLATITANQQDDISDTDVLAQLGQHMDAGLAELAAQQAAQLAQFRADLTATVATKLQEIRDAIAAGNADEAKDIADELARRLAA